MCGGRLRIAARSCCGVSPVRTKVRMSMLGQAERAQLVAMPASGASRLRWMSFESALSGETYTTWVSSASVPVVRAVAHQLVDGGEEGRQRLARAGGRGDQHVAPRRDLRPRRLLCRGGCGEGALEPGADGRMKLGGHERIEAQPRSAGQPSRRDLMQRTAPRGTPRCTRRPRARGPGSRAAAAALALRAVPPRPRRTGRQHFAVRSHGDAPSRNAMLPVRTAPGPRPQRRSGRTLQRRVKSQP